MKGVGLSKCQSNPYIDYDLLQSQSLFSPAHNKHFEMKHAVSLNLIPSKQREKQEKRIIFEWNRAFSSNYECDTQHLLYLIYVALIQVEQRQIHKNAYYIKLKRDDRVLPLLDKKDILTNLITWHLRDPAKHKLDGQVLQSMAAKEFINNILTKHGGKHCSMGWSTKIYSKLCYDVDCHQINGTVSIPNYKYESLST
eukprot:CAMPEP_0197036918 /NCGR_PEP_ID=MMETSP1384-20130603/14269_1 /TAXON_ID=29189 /ORGANISM="Ammonia sp." /LENGTH=196 /DNA_ID=CAMNT_0042467147 /DNA_START=281 /DNA_END=871 /DNA_ORIENTATION=-